MWNRHLQEYYDLVAQHYIVELDPTFASLAQGLLSLANIEQGEWVIDVGAGTGAVSRIALSRTPHVYSVDFSRKMLISASGWGRAVRIQCDMHQLSVRSASFDIALASFSLNATDLSKCISELRRVLAPEGRLVGQEWGTEDELSELLFNTLAEYAVESPSTDLELLREMVSRPIPWDNIGTLEVLKDVIVEGGFQIKSITVENVPIVYPTSKEFIRSKLAWPSRRREVGEMSPEVRRIFFSELEEQLSHHNEEDGTLIWRPEVIRFDARKQS